MFGFLRPGCGDSRVTEYRRVYAAMCVHQRQQYGHLSSFFHSYEAIFLYHLAIESLACEPPSAQTPQCCRLRSDPSNRWRLDHRLADFLSAFAMVLAAVKIEDDVRDHRTWLTTASERVFRKRFAVARRKLDEIAPNLSQFIAEKVEEHLRFERKGVPYPLEQYVEPTAQAFATVFEAFEQLCHSGERRLRWGQIGYAVGSAIIAADCAVDFEQDRKLGQYNPLASRSEVTFANDFARRSLAQAGWLSTSQYDQSVCSFLARSAFDRLSHRPPTTPVKNRRRWLTAQARRGDCDCLCPGEICCEVGNCIDVASCITCEAPNLGGCCETNEAGCLTSLDCCNGCDLCLGGGDCSRKKKQADQRDQPGPHNQPPTPPQHGHAHGAIDPFGVVKLAGMFVPARASVPIAAGSRVNIISQNSLGVDVQPA